MNSNELSDGKLDTAKKGLPSSPNRQMEGFLVFLFKPLILVVETEQYILIIVAESLTV